MIRTRARRMVYWTRLPRMRGDDPLKALYDDYENGFAPHARG